MQRPLNTSKWGTDTAAKRYADGGRTLTEKLKGPEPIGGGGGGGYSGGRGPGSPKGDVIYNIPKDMKGLPGPPSFRDPATGKNLNYESRVLDSNSRNWHDMRPNQTTRTDTKGYEAAKNRQLRRLLKEGANNDAEGNKRGGRISSHKAGKKD